MYAKTEIYYMMRDKVIPSLINSEKIIKFEDIKEVLEKSSYWKKNNFKNINNTLSNNKSKYIIFRNKTLSNKKIKFTKNKMTKSNTERKNLIKTNLFKDLLQINYHNNKTRNYNLKISHKLENSEPEPVKTFKTFNSQRTQVNFCNPILKSFSNKMNKLQNKNSPFKTERAKSKNNIFLKDSFKYKNYLEFKNYKNILKKIKNDYEYKTFYYFKKSKIEKHKNDNNIIKKDEENNHLILRGLALNDEQKKLYSKCQLINVDMEDYKKKYIYIKPIINNEKNTNNNKIRLNKNRKFLVNDYLRLNIGYSLKGLVDFKNPFNI